MAKMCHMNDRLDAKSRRFVSVDENGKLLPNTPLWIARILVEMYNKHIRILGKEIGRYDGVHLVQLYPENGEPRVYLRVISGCNGVGMGTVFDV